MSNDNNIYSPPNPQESLLEAALRYAQLGYRVIPTTANKSPACGEGWNKPDWRQDEETLNNLFSNDRVAGIAIVLYPRSDLISIDFDGECSTKLWQSPVKLDDACRHNTPHGGHILFKPSKKFGEIAESLGRKVRFLEAGPECQCTRKCGLDFLVNGYVIVPPTPGYVDRVSIENATELPDKILDSILQKLEEKKINPSHQSERFDIDAALAGVEEGQRGEILFRYASSLRARAVVQSEAVILVKTAAAKCHPPYKEKPIENLVEDVYKRYCGPAEDINLKDLGIESFTDHG